MAFLALVLNQHVKSPQKYEKYFIYASAHAFFYKKVPICVNFHFPIFVFQLFGVSLYAKLGILWIEQKYRSMVSLA